MYPANPLWQSVKENRKKYYIRKVSESAENDIVHLEFEPIKQKDTTKLFSGNMWIKKSNFQLLKLQLYINHASNHPFLPIRVDDKLKNVDLNLTYHFSQFKESTRLTLIDLKFGFDYQSTNKGIVDSRYIKTEGLVHLYDDAELFYLPFYKYDFGHNDYRRLSLFPYDSTFWIKNKALEVTEKQRLRYDKFAKDGFVLNFDDISNLRNNEAATSRVNGFFEYNNVFWKKNNVVQLGRNESSTVDVADIVVQLYLDINKFDEIFHYRSVTILDVFNTKYNLANKPEHLVYLNLFFDHCEIIRMEMEEALNKTQDLKAVSEIHKNATQKINDLQAKFKKELKYGHNIRNIPIWNQKVIDTFGKDNVKYFGLIIPDY